VLATFPTRQELDAPQHRKRCTLQQYLNKAAAQVKAEDFKTAQKTLDSVRLTAIEHNFPWVEAEALRGLVCASFTHSLALACLEAVDCHSVHELSRRERTQAVALEPSRCSLVRRRRRRRWASRAL
jgi:hypothetical protein